MALFKNRDKARKSLNDDLHRSAFAGALESYQFWGHDYKVAWDEYIKRINDLNGKPVSLARFRKELQDSE